MPQAHDQFDNAYRVQRLGLGQWCRSQRPESLFRALSRVLADDLCRKQCQQQSYRVGCGLDQACQHIEDLMTRPLSFS